MKIFDHNLPLCLLFGRVVVSMTHSPFPFSILNNFIALIAGCQSETVLVEPSIAA